MNRKNFSLYILRLSKVCSLTSIGQCVYALASILILRFISIENYGQAACLIAYTNFFSSLVTLRYETTIINAQDEAERNGLFQLSIYCALVFSSLTSLLIFPLKFIFARELTVNFEIFFICLCLTLFTAKVSAVKNIYIQKGDFKNFGPFIFLNYVFRATFPFLFLLLTKSWKALLYGEIIGNGLTILASYKVWSVAFQQKQSQHIIALIKKYADYPKFFLPSTILDNITFSLLIPFINYLYGSTAAGQFALCFKIVLLPIAFLGRIIGDIFHHDMVKSLKEKCTKFVFKQNVALFSIMSLLVFYLVLAPSVPFIVKTFLSKHTPAFCKIFYPMLIWGSVQFVVSPLSRALLVKPNGVRRKFLYDIVSFLSLFFVVFISKTMNLSFYKYINLLSGFMIVSFIVYYYIINKFIKDINVRDIRNS